MTRHILYPYQRRYLADTSRFKAGMWSRQTGKTFTTTLEAVLDVLEAEAADPAEQVKLLSQAARAVAEASRASIGQKKWAEEVRAKLDEIERAAGRAGRTLDADTLKAVREGLYGG